MPRVVGQESNVFKRCTCQQCAAINEYTPGEVRLLWQGRDYGGGNSGAKGFNCAHCGKEVIVESW